MAFTFKATTYPAPLKPGLYPAKLVGVEVREDDLGDYLTWHFRIDQEDERKDCTMLWL